MKKFKGDVASQLKSLSKTAETIRKCGKGSMQTRL